MITPWTETEEIVKGYLTDYYLMVEEDAEQAIYYTTFYDPDLFRKEDCTVESLAAATRETYLASKGWAW